jgi:hypothetical protein
VIFIDPCYKPSSTVPALPFLPPVRLDLPEPAFPLDREIVNFLRDQR